MKLLSVVETCYSIFAGNDYRVLFLYGMTRKYFVQWCDLFYNNLYSYTYTGKVLLVGYTVKYILITLIFLYKQFYCNVLIPGGLLAQPTVLQEDPLLEKNVRYMNTVHR